MAIPNKDSDTALSSSLWTFPLFMLIFWRNCPRITNQEPNWPFVLDLVKLLIGNFSARRLSASSRRLEGGHWPIKFSKGRCKRCLKRNKGTWCRMACELCGKRICLDCFKDSNFDRIAEETNRYARHAMETKPDPAWRETDAEEVKAFFALNILFGIKQLPEVYSYWSRNQLLGVPEVQKIFPRNHFAKISQYLHLNGN